MLSLIALAGIVALAPASAATRPPTESSATEADASVKDPSDGRRAGARFMLMGAGLFSATYGVSTLVAAIQMDDPAHGHLLEANAALAVPLVGPIIAATRTDNTRKHAGLGFSGTGQALGLGIAAAGLAITAGAARKGEPAPRRKNDLLLGAVIGGATVGTVAYLASAAISKASPDENPVGRRRMFIPVVGGFMAMPHSARYVQMWARGASSAIQLVSLAAVVGGAIGMRRNKVRKRQAALAVVPGRDGPKVTFAMRF